MEQFWNLKLGRYKATMLLLGVQYKKNKFSCQILYKYSTAELPIVHIPMYAYVYFLSRKRSLVL